MDKPCSVQPWGQGMLRCIPGLISSGTNDFPLPLSTQKLAENRQCVLVTITLQALRQKGA